MYPSPLINKKSLNLFILFYPRISIYSSFFPHSNTSSSNMMSFFLIILILFLYTLLLPHMQIHFVISNYSRITPLINTCSLDSLIPSQMVSSYVLSPIISIVMYDSSHVYPNTLYPANYIISKINPYLSTPNMSIYTLYLYDAIYYLSSPHSPSSSSNSYRNITPPNSLLLYGIPCNS